MEDEDRIGAGPIVAVTLGIIAAAGVSLFRSFSNLYGMADLAFGPVSGPVMYLFGQATVFSLAAFAVIYFAYLRWRDEQRTMTYLLITIVSVFVIDFGVFALFAFGLQGAQRSADQDRNAMLEITFAMDNAGRVSGGRLVSKIISTGDAAVVERAAKLTAAQIRAAAEAYRDEVLAVDFPAVTAPERLGRKGGLVAARAALARLHKAAADYRAGIKKATAQFVATAPGLDVSPSVRSGLLARTLRLIVNYGGVRDAEVAAQDSMYGEFDALVALLSHANGPWMFQKGSFMFSSQRDLDSFNSHVARIRGLEISATQPDGAWDRPR
ncbi:MAG: hypothetical protein JSR60_08300 [Proteobacteria bacterium]|nr:hypothetical protein [Pseudomonadota bacterium]